MKHTYDYVLSPRTNLPVVGASVGVYLAGTTTLAGLYAVNDKASPPIANPIITVNDGAYSFYVADGAYDLVVDLRNGVDRLVIPDVEIFDLTDLAARFDQLDQVEAATASSASAAAGSAASAGQFQVGAQAAQTGAQTARTGAETARTGAETARTGAETARDALVLAAGMYATEAIGRAAVADGTLFRVVGGDASTAVLVYRRDSANGSTLLTAFPSKAAVDQVASIVRSGGANGRLFEFLDALGRIVAYIDIANRLVIPTMRATSSYEVGTTGRAIVDNFDPRSIGKVADKNGNTLLDARASGTRIAAVKALTVEADMIGGRRPSALTAFFGHGGIVRSDIELLVNISYGQSLSVGTNTSNNPADSALLTPVDYYHNLMFKGGVFYPASNNDVSALVPYAAIRQPNGGPGETIHGGYNAMMAQLFNAYGVTPLANRMSTISMAPGQGETPIDGFLEGTGLFDRMLLGVQAAVNLAAGRKVVVAPVKWMQYETQGPNDANYVAQLMALANSVDTRIRAITGQTEQVGLLTYQGRAGDSSFKFSTAARQAGNIRIAGGIWDLKVGGLSGSQYDFVHMANEGYFMYGARCAVADFCAIYLKRTWRPLQIARDARGRVKARIVGKDLVVQYDVPFDGELAIDPSNPNITRIAGVTNGDLNQQGFFLLDGNGNNLPLLDVVVASRNEVALIGAAAQPGYTLNVGSPALTRAYTAGCTLRDRMGDILTIDDLGHRPLHNPAIGEGWTMTAQELGL